MAGMMLPSILPMVLLFAAVQRQSGARPVLATGTFVSGYLLVWAGFAARDIAGPVIHLDDQEATVASPGERQLVLQPHRPPSFMNDCFPASVI